ncbi:MAG TPA: acyl-ACP desaturase [Patescibacteria group bacterium]|nr:acyl-ACP desaturase [Patescibacteria group bacterium]
MTQATISPEAIQANPEFDPHFLNALAEHGQQEFDHHQAIRKDWSYHDVLDRDVTAKLAVMPPLQLDPEVANIYLGNLVVEKGHAEYDRVTALVFQGHPVFRAWKDTWVAEEEQHGDAMLQWAKVRGLFPKTSDGAVDMGDVHRNIQGYLKHGLALNFDDAAFGMAYPALQEIATRITHKEVKDRLPTDEMVGRVLLSKIIADEERHERFYAAMVRHALHDADPAMASHQMRGVARSMLGFAMPGIEGDIPDGEQITAAYQHTGAFSISKVARDVLIPMLEDEGPHGWNIAGVEFLDTRARRAQERLVKFREDMRAKVDSDRGLILVLGKARRELQQAA